MKRLVVFFVFLASISHAGAYMTFGRYLGDQYGSEPDTQSGAVWDASLGVFEKFDWFTPYGSIQTIMDGEGGGGFHPTRVIYKVGAEIETLPNLFLIVEHMCDHHVDSGDKHEIDGMGVYGVPTTVLANHKNQQYNFVGVRYNFW